MNRFFIYPLLIALLYLAMQLYIKLAGRFNIIDRPNERSSHNYITIRGGGIIFWLAGVMYFVVCLL